MKFFIINTDYQDFIDKKYRQNPEIKNILHEKVDTFIGLSFIRTVEYNWRHERIQLFKNTKLRLLFYYLTRIIYLY